MNRDTAVAPVARPALGETEDAVLGLVRDVLGRPAIGLDDDMFDHGATSLSFVRVLAGVGKRFSVTVHAASLAGVATPRTIAAGVVRELAASAVENRGSLT